MKTSNNLVLSFMIGIALCACHQENETSDRSTATAGLGLNQEAILKVDLKQDLSGKSLQELRLLRNSLYAKQGYCFMQADLRGYFSGHMKGYDSIMEARFWDEDAEKKTVAPISFSKEEHAFIKKIEALEAEKKKNNFLLRDGHEIGNVQNIINLFQFKDLSNNFMTLLDKYNCAIVPTDNIQLFHVYEKNDYGQIPNFVTTDTYLQLYHMYFSYLLKSVEKEKFIPALTELSEGMYEQAIKMSESSPDAAVKDCADYAAVFYAIPYYILTGNKKTVSPSYKGLLEKELENIESEVDATSEFLGYKNSVFPYSLYKPRGHYTRSPELKKYFKAMMWLQTASFCRSTEEELKRSTLLAHFLDDGKSKSGKKLLDLYNSIYEPIVFLIGEPDNLSVNDIVNYFKANSITDVSVIFKKSTQEKIDIELQKIVKARNKIKPKIEVSCSDKINFMPQRYLFDNEILQELVDVTPDADRAYPKGLDLFASLGNQTAKDILLNEQKEESQWEKYPSLLNKLEKKFENYSDWDKTVYNKWIETLLLMQKKDKNYPAFMKTDMWDRKNLNTSLASWTDLKHDAILYGEQPEGAECGGGGPPPPYTVGYVEPNLPFWKNMLELLTLTESVLKRNGLMNEDINSKTMQLKESAQFLYSASEKEIRRQKLSEQEYRTIEAIGASIEYLTLSIVEPEKSLQFWENVSGPDKAVAVVADVYTRNIRGCRKNGILHEAVGNVNEIYVVVEIEGYLYLTKGATFSYFEFVQPLGTRLTDEEWQKKLEEKKDLPAIPAWLKDIVLPAKDIPTPDEKIFYSSGC
jgi:hypothetical protein